MNGRRSIKFTHLRQSLAAKEGRRGRAYARKRALSGTYLSTVASMSKKQYPLTFKTLVDFGDALPACRQGILKRAIVRKMTCVYILKIRAFLSQKPP